MIIVDAETIIATFFVLILSRRHDYVFVDVPREAMGKAAPALSPRDGLALSHATMQNERRHQ
jgi:hypothetical protein